ARGGAGGGGGRPRPPLARRDRGRPRALRDVARGQPAATVAPAAAPADLDRGDATAGAGVDRTPRRRLGSLVREPGNVRRPERAARRAPGAPGARAVYAAALGRGGRDRRRVAGRARAVDPAVRRGARP